MDRQKIYGSLTQVVVGRLQGCTALPQDVHLKHRLWLDVHSEGGDGMLIDAFCHSVIQKLDQLLYISTELLQTSSNLWLQRRETGLIRSRNTKRELILNQRRCVMCVPTLIRNLRESSTRVTLVRPALWQMDTVLVDQAVEKFNLKSTNQDSLIYCCRTSALCLRDASSTPLRSPEHLYPPVDTDSPERKQRFLTFN